MEIREDVHWKLKAVIAHLGNKSIHKGHCVAVARAEVMGRDSWLRLDDVKSPSLEVLASPFNSELHKNGVLLPYERINAPMPPLPSLPYSAAAAEKPIEIPLQP